MMRTFSAGLLTLALGAGVPSARAGADGADGLKAIQQDFNELVAQYATAPPAGREVIVNALAGLAEKAVKLAETDAKVAAEAQTWAAHALGGLPPTDRVIGLLRPLTEKGAGAGVKAQACLSLARGLARRAETTDNRAKASDLSGEAEALFERVIKDYAGVKDSQGDPLADTAKVALFEIRNLTVGCKAPDVESKDLDGKAVKLSDHKGKVVVLDIWATWCGPCVRMIPHERELVNRLKDKPFVLVSVSADAEKKTLTDFIAKEPMPWTHWHNGATGGILKDWNVRALPAIYVLDHKGVIRFKGVQGEAMDKAVEQLLKELEDEKKP
jgi:thiol-disulfide isomerase/thioredoxin